MVDIPDDIMRTATEIVDRIAKYHTWKGVCVADVASALLSERQRTDAAKAMCDEMAKALGSIAYAPYGESGPNLAESIRIARRALAAYDKAQEVGNDR